MAGLRLSLLGAFEATLDGKPLTGIKTDKARALLIYLAVERGRAHRRQSLAGLLWPDYPENGARANLRHALANLRQALGEDQNPIPFLLVEGETIQFNSQSDYWVDVTAFDDLAASSRVAAGQAGPADEGLQATIGLLYRGGFLEGFALKDSPDFDNWTAILRERYLGQASAALGKLAEGYEQSKDYEKAISFARRRLELEPWQEQAHFQLMRLLALSGQRAAALAQYEVCCKILKEELGVEPSVETLRLYARIRDGEISAPVQAKPKSHNLPAQVTSFIGREKEIAEITALLGRGEAQTQPYLPARLVTLTGAGGTGKTRLALQTARELLEQYPDGVWLVELAPLADPGLVVEAAAQAVGMRLASNPQSLSFLQDYLEPKDLLLILDNCEHLIEACARLADALLHACPHLRILASSREGLGIDGETSYRVPPLAVPEAGELPAVEALAQFEAVRLFVERASAASPGFQLTPANAPAIAQVCQRLDGIPLALELAAARVKLLRVEEIALRLDDRFRLLTGGSRLALPRYQTLRASIDWSYDLLSEAERLLLQRLSVFAGGWVLEAAEKVGCGEEVESFEVLDLLGQLVNKSLVIVEAEMGHETRYRMLETIRQYAHEKLVESGEAESVCDRHLEYYVALAERVENKIRGLDQAVILNHLENELGNIRLAFEWCTSLPKDKARAGWLTEQGLRLGAALLWFWHCHGRHDEGYKWLISLLARETEQGAIPDIMDEAHSPAKAMVRAKALWVAGYQKTIKGDVFKANELFMESRELYKELGAQGKKGYALALYSLSGMASDQENLNLPEKYIEESLSIFQEEGDRFWISEVLASLGTVARQKREPERARVYFEKSLALFKEIGDPEGTAYALFLLGALFLDPFPGADPVQKEQARALLEESREIFLKINSDSIFMPLEALGTLSWRQGDYAKAEAYLEDDLSLGRNQWITNSLVYCLIALGRLALSKGDRQQAAERFEESLAISLKGEPQFNIIWSLTYAGLMDWEAGDFEQASQKYAQALAIRQRLGISGPPQTFLGSGRVFLARSEYGPARTYLEQALEISLSDGDQETIYSALEAFAILAARQKEKAIWAELERAARLLGATDAWHMEWQLTRLPRERQERESAIAAVRGALGEEAFAKAWEEGKAMTLEQAIAYAKEEDNT
jgi:predicted ATPase/DNA-binding SARP family transcriptional activator